MHRFGAFIARSLIWIIFKTIARIRVAGMENVPANGGYVVASNHIGRLDAPLVYYLLDRHDITLLVAEKYKKVALFRWAVRQLDSVFIDRFNPDIHALRTALSRLKAGGVLVLAPEGTRSQSGQLNEARSGTSYLATKIGAPIVPVGVTGTEDSIVFSRLMRLRRLDLSVRIGEPFTLPRLPVGDREAALERYTDEIMCRIAALLPDDHRGYYRGHPRLKELLGEAG
jgi:1-acyl-sn-glycerol-3-phosphate acyltransferase